MASTPRQSYAHPRQAPGARALTARQQKFVDHYIENGGKLEQAAIDAGYAEAGAGNQARQLVRNPKVYTEVMRRVPDLLGRQAVPAIAVVVRLMQSAKSDYVKLEAARDILDRAGFQPAQRVDHRLDTTLSVAINLGGSKTAPSESVTHPGTRNSLQKLDLAPSEWSEDQFPYGMGDAPVEISTPVVKNTTWADDAAGD